MIKDNFFFFLTICAFKPVLLVMAERSFPALIKIFVAVVLQSERPDAILGVICGAVHIADAGISKRYVNFKSALER